MFYFQFIFSLGQKHLGNDLIEYICVSNADIPLHCPWNHSLIAEQSIMQKALNDRIYFKMSKSTGFS